MAAAGRELRHHAYFSSNNSLIQQWTNAEVRDGGRRRERRVGSFVRWAQLNWLLKRSW